METIGLMDAGPAVRIPRPGLAIRVWTAHTLHRLTALRASIVRAVTDRSGASRTGAGPAARLARAATSGPSSSAAPGDGAFHEIMLPHLNAAYNLARFLTRDADAADDVVQDAFLRAFRAFGGFRGGDARAWLLTIVRNCTRSWANERKRARTIAEPAREASQSDEGTDDDQIADLLWQPDPDTPETALLRESEARAIRRLIEALPDAFREVLVLREFDDLSYRQIAEITGVPIGTVMSRLARARDMFGLAWRRLNCEGER